LPFSIPAASRLPSAPTALRVILPQPGQVSV
jgi:hypothetical protein